MSGVMRSQGALVGRGGDARHESVARRPESRVSAPDEMAEIERLRRIVRELERAVRAEEREGPASDAALPAPDTSARIGDLIVDLAARTVRRGSVEIRLTRRQFDLLELLLQHRGHTVAAAVLRERLWSGAADDAHPGGLRNLILSLRRRLWPGGDGALWIRSAFGAGYRLLPDEALDPSSDVDAG